MNLIYYLFGHSERIAKLKAQEAELKRQHARVAPAYALHREVLHAYGLEVYAKLAHPDDIIEDDKSICVINYLDI